MKLELNTNLIPIFTGTYNTIWGEDETYEVDNFDLYLKSILNAYEDNKVRINELPPNWLQIIKFTDTHSPREYNFKTDELDFKVKLNKLSMLKALKPLQNDSKFADYLRDNFTSRDGFWSFTPNSFEELSNELKTEGEEFEQSIGALVNYLCDKYIMQGIEIEMYENWYGKQIDGVKFMEVQND